MNNYFDASFPRSGKWTSEEESYANKLISEFEAGTLVDCIEGCTLRAYLAKRLNCAPMRISKKFAGQCIGKVFLLMISSTNHIYFIFIIYAQHTFTKKDPADEEVARANSRSSAQPEFADRHGACSSSASTSSAATSNASTVDPDEPKYTAMKGDMSFDTFTEFQQNQTDPWSAFSVPAPRTSNAPPSAGPGPKNFWSTFAPGYLASSGKHHGRSPSFCAQATETPAGMPEEAVGLDIDDPEPASYSPATSQRSNSYGGMTDTSSLTASPASVMGRRSFVRREAGSTERVQKVAPTMFFPPPPQHSPWSSTLLRCPSEGMLHAEGPSAAQASLPGSAFFAPPRCSVGSQTMAPMPVPMQVTLQTSLQQGQPPLLPFYEGPYFSSGFAGLLSGVNEAEEWRDVLTFFCGPAAPASAPARSGANAAATASSAVHFQ